ncbi:MAG: Coenzyme F420 hydrogenase/dehydrogenase, beta subunit C-terminal domain [Deltaproteobacteria bacterium]|nr:Coenzyme F420 hydrogenase/dehydrogenase, beta subunit C-terminal domain [Deltaproteobacteria bacterium]
MSLFGPNELIEDVINKNLCIGCGACIELCPYFRSYKGRTAMLFPCTKEEGRCYAFCPKIEVDLDRLSEFFFQAPYSGAPLGRYRSIHTAKAGPKADAGDFQAGGTVSALIGFALRKGYFDAAVLTDKEGILPVPRIITDPADVSRCSTSKYTSAPTLSALNQAVRQGYKHIGVVGTPCQVLAVAQMRMNPTAEPDFSDPIALTLGLFCTWSVYYRAFEPFIAARVDISRVIKVDIPPPPAEVMEIYTAEEKIEIGLDEIRELVPDTCSYCIDMTSEFADISVGVLEGRTDMNTLIVRTERGQKIVDEAVAEGFLVLEDMPGENLEHLQWAAGNKKKRAFAKAREEGMINGAEGTRSYLRVDPATVSDCIA